MRSPGFGLVVLAAVTCALGSVAGRADDRESRFYETGTALLTPLQSEYRDYYRRDDDRRDVDRPRLASFDGPPLFRVASDVSTDAAHLWLDGDSSTGDSASESAACRDDHDCDGCAGGDGCCDSCRRRRCLCGLILQSDPEFQNFVSPISNPLFFEDPRTLTGFNLLFIEHSIPRSNPVLQGGDVRVWAAQIRAALTERLSIVAAKDGWININSPGVGPRDGFADLNVGLKYNLVRDPAAQLVVSAGFGYEIPVGQDDVFQGNGDGEWHFYLTGGKQLADELFWISGTGFRIPNDHNLGSQMWYWSNSFAWRFLPGARYGTGWYAMWEINWFHWMRSGNAFPFNFEGTDLINFGSNDVAGNDIVTMFWGPKWKPTPLQEIGAGIEIPVTERRDLYRNRVYAHWILRF